MGRLSIFAIGLALVLGGCGDRGQGILADQATDLFYKRVDAKDFQTLYADSAPEFKAGTPAPVFIGFMSRIARKLGPCQPPAKAADWRVNFTTNGYFRGQGYTRQCANGQLSEYVTVVVRGGEAKIFAYNANSPLLMTD